MATFRGQAWMEVEAFYRPVPVVGRRGPVGGRVACGGGGGRDAPRQRGGGPAPARPRGGVLVTTRRTGWIVGGLAVALVLSTLAPVIGGAVLVLAVPAAVAGSILTRRRRRATRTRMLPSG